MSTGTLLNQAKETGLSLRQRVATMMAEVEHPPRWISTRPVKRAKRIMLVIMGLYFLSMGIDISYANATHTYWASIPVIKWQVEWNLLWIAYAGVWFFSGMVKTSNAAFSIPSLDLKDWNEFRRRHNRPLIDPREKVVLPSWLCAIIAGLVLLCAICTATFWFTMPLLALSVMLYWHRRWWMRWLMTYREHRTGPLRIMTVNGPEGKTRHIVGDVSALPPVKPGDAKPGYRQVFNRDTGIWEWRQEVTGGDPANNPRPAPAVEEGQIGTAKSLGTTELGSHIDPEDKL